MKTIQKLLKLIHLVADSDTRKVLLEVYEAAKADFQLYKTHEDLIHRIVNDVEEVKGVLQESRPQIDATVKAFQDADALLKKEGFEV
jgi:hypothetical protein